MAESPRRFPLLRADLLEACVFGGAKIAMRRLRGNYPAAALRPLHARFKPGIEAVPHELPAQESRAKSRRHPAIIEDAVTNGVVVVREQLEHGTPARRPRNVVPQHRRLVACDQLASLCLCIPRIVTTRSRAHEVRE